MLRALLLVLVVLFPSLLSAQKKDDAAAIFEKRLLPIFQSPKPSSCTGCHLSGVDLKQYILPTQEQTFAALLKMEMIDPQHPEKSKILEFIERAPEKTSLVSQKVRQQEYAAFKSWIVAAAKDPKLLKAKPTRQAGPTIPDEVIRHARKDRVLQSFIDNVWSEVGRCAACHSPDRNQKQVKEHGKYVSWIVLNDPQGTLDYMVENEILNTKKPEDSYLLLKPTNQIKHGGGIKLQVGDRTYRQFLKFATDYAQTVNGKYKSAAELPEQNDEIFQVSDIWFKLTGVPEIYDKKLLRVNIYRQTGDGPDSFSADRWATADRGVFGGGKLWQNHLSLAAPRGLKRAEQIRKQPRLPEGRYLIKVYIDKKDKLATDPDAELTEEDFVGEVITRSPWPGGYGRMTVVEYPNKN
jgi:hypothetical protein